VQLGEILTQSLSEPDNIIALLPDMEPFRLGQPLDAGRNINYIGGIDVSALSSDVPVPLSEFADFTTDESSNEDDKDDLMIVCFVFF
jgi:hypothetical protein